MTAPILPKAFTICDLLFTTMPRKARRWVSSRYAHFPCHFKVPICNDLWHTLRMQELFSVSIMSEYAHASLGDERLSRRLPRLAEALARQPQASIPKATGC